MVIEPIKDTNPNMFESNGGPAGIRTPDLSLVIVSPFGYQPNALTKLSHGPLGTSFPMMNKKMFLSPACAGRIPI